MWLFNSKDDDKVIYLKSNSENVVGRNFGDIVFPNDKSVSRKHATICVNAEEITIDDHKSTYGTYLNHGISQQKRIDPGIKISLKANDTVKFGMLGSEWTLRQLCYTTCLSTIKEENMTFLKAQLQDLGVTISKDWQPDCTHLTMPAITLTLKVVLALVHLRPIVTPKFWTECLRRRDGNLPLPSPEVYLPSIKESALNRQANFHVDGRRSTLFVGKNFIFFSRLQHMKYNCIIEAAGGTSCLLRDCKMTAQLCTAPSIVVQYTPVRSSQDTQETQTHIDNIIKYMANKKCRVIPESEIGLAILYVSTEKNCNPLFNFSSLIIEKQDNVAVPTTVAHILALETQEIPETECSRRAVPFGRVQETLTSLTSDRSAVISQSSMTSSKDCSGFLDRSFLKSERGETKKIKAPSPGLEEPLAKRKSSHNLCAQPLAPEKNTLFQFIEETPSPSTSKTSDNLQLNIKSGKRKRKNPYKEEELFNFVPDVVESGSGSEPAPLRLSPFKTSGVQKETTLNLHKSVKRKFDGSDNVDGKRKNFNKIDSDTESSGRLTNTMLGVNISEKLDTSSVQWLSKKQFSISHSTVKKKDPEGSISSETSVEDEVLLKLEELDLRPAIVEVNNDLIVRKFEGYNTGLGHVSLVNGKKNFKKFSKVKPLRPHTEVLSSDMLVVYVGKTINADLEKFMNVSSDEKDENDEFDSFMSISKHKKASGCRKL